MHCIADRGRSHLCVFGQGYGVRYLQAQRALILCGNLFEKRFPHLPKTFEYTYSAERQKEIEDIRKKYAAKEEDKMEQLRKLDRDAEKPGTIAAIALGVFGMLVFGGGLSLALVWTDTLLAGGIVFAMAGIGIMATALPVYKVVMKKQREKIAPQILELSEELMR